MLSSTQTVDRTLSLPDATDTLVGKATTDTLTNKTLTSPTITGGALNGTMGATTPSTGAFTTLAATGNISTTGGDVLIRGAAGGQITQNGGAGGLYITNTGTSTAMRLLVTNGAAASVTALTLAADSGAATFASNVAITGTLSVTNAATITANSSAYGLILNGRSSDNLTVVAFRDNTSATNYGGFEASSSSIKTQIGSGFTTITNVTSTGLAVTGSVSDTAGNVRLIPQNSQSAAYTLVLADAGKHILHPSADTTARTFTIPANSSVAYTIGTAITIINQNAGGVITISITTDTMRLAGAGTTGSRTLAANGVATCVKITSTEWIISGTGLT
jgi:hypothetical protein